MRATRPRFMHGRTARQSGRAARSWLGGMGGAAFLAACVVSPQLDGRATQPPPARKEAGYEASAESRELQRYYAQLQADLLARGLMRTDGGSRDAPFNSRILVRNFIRIAMYDEFDGSSGNLVARETESRLRRWARPVRVALRFGASVAPGDRSTERARVASYLARLSRLTGQSVRLNDQNPNFFLYFVDEDERRALGPEIRANMPGITAAEIEAFTRMPTATYCQVTAAVDNATSEYRRAFAVIRSEHPELLHLSCLHEEMAQGLGLPNDSPSARPSIFNDDQEFALLTPMDELLLQILYDGRLAPGMTIAQARPVIEMIAAEKLGGPS
ncbi:MAG: DUF2927 domain-containing protein [Pseudorhodobacter sp.]